MEWIAIYLKPGSNFERNPFDCTAHGWKIEAKSADEALVLLEQQPDVPWRLYLVEIIAAETFAKWSSEFLDGETITLHT